MCLTLERRLGKDDRGGKAIPARWIVVVDVLQVLEGLAHVGFIAGAIFAVLELRGISRERRANTVVDMY